ncbi:condensation domain-containing protein [Streptomyces solincola]|uniref:condensation domain-containing protein n=1 Tax=Streptomyces solincola TaxID=2100817 RepID=UPI00215911E9|nr:condensation domain-containing protein [Streptomyces solincola]
MQGDTGQYVPSTTGQHIPSTTGQHVPSTTEPYAPSITGQYLERFGQFGRPRAAGDAVLLPVTGAQRRFLLVRALDRSGRPDLVPMFFAFPRGTVDAARLSAAATHLAGLHPALRSRPTVVRGVPVLRLAAPDVPVTRVGCREGEGAADALRRALAAWAADGPPMRMLLADEGDQELLAVVFDHAVCDGWSLGRVVEELGIAYVRDATADDVEEAEAEGRLDAYRTAVLAQLDTEERASSPPHLAYWGERLRRVRERTGAMRARKDPLADGPVSGAASALLPAGHGGTAFPALLDACTAAVRELYGAAEDALAPVGYPWGGRPAGAEPVVGCFLNTLVFAAGSRGGAPGATADGWWDDLDRADTPFDAVVRAARAAGSRWGGGLDGLLTVDAVRDRPPLTLDGVPGREVEVGGRAVRGPFAVSVTQGSELRVRMVWDRAVLADRDAERAFAAFTGALGGAG